MKTDLSFVLYEEYFKLKNRQIEVELRNHLVLTGKFLGVFRGNKTYIIKWHLVEAEELFGEDKFGFLVGDIINHEDILKIKFLDNNFIMNF